MLVVMRHNATQAEIANVVEVIEVMGHQGRPIPGKQRTAVGLIGNDGGVDSARLQVQPGVLEVIAVTQPYKQVSREWREEDTVITLDNGTIVGGSDIVVMAGPCAVEGEREIIDIAFVSWERPCCGGGRIQAEDITVLLPRPGPAGTRALGEGARGDRLGHRDRGP